MELEKLLAFHQLVLDNTEEEKLALAHQFGIDYSEYKKRIVGKEKESEFIIIMKSLGILKHLEAYDEGLSHITGEYTPDFKIEMNDGHKMLLEIKHTGKDIFTISQGNLQNRIDFADRQDLPLRFAVSLKGYWGLFTSETLKENRGKLTLDDFIGEKSTSWLDREFATCSYMFPQPIKIKSVYSKNHPKSIPIQFQPYGHLVSYELYCGNRRIFRVKGQNSPYLSHCIYLEALQNRAANSHQDKQQQGEFTVITDYFDTEHHTIPEYEFLLAPISHTCKVHNSEVIPYDAQSAISDHSFNFCSVQLLRVILNQLVDLGMEIIVFRGAYGYRFKDYASNFWTMSADSSET